MTSARVSAPDAPVIRLRSASFGYADRAVVSGADLTVAPGEVLAVALLGPNGCGKSTLVKGLLGLNDHLGGEVELFGTPLARFRQRYRIGYVPQRHTLSGSVSATVREVVATSREPLDADGDLDGLSWEQLELLAHKNRVLDELRARIPVD